MVGYFLLKFAEWRRQREVERRYYQTFGDLDRAIRKAYRFSNPYRISTNYLKELYEPNIYQYGETPLTVFEKIGKALNLGSKSHLMDLGSGRGRGAFFLHNQFGCTVTGVEQIPIFVQKALNIVAAQDLRNINFRCENLLKTDLTGVTHVFFYGICMDDDDVEQVAQKLKSYSITIASVSFPLGDFEVLKTLMVNMPWGYTEVFIQKNSKAAIMDSYEKKMCAL